MATCTLSIIFPIATHWCDSIPKGSTVLANHWSIHMDPDVYPEPETFNPDRFVKNGKLVGTKYSEKGHHGFGFVSRSFFEVY